LDTLLELKGIGKSFGSTRALNQVGLTLRAGEVCALIGENGAGKSTLMKVLSGAYRLDEGEVRVKGEACRFHSPQDARSRGIAMIYQELTLAPHLTVEENITLGSERSSWGMVRPQRERIKKALELLGHPSLPLDSPVSHLSIGHQQVVEIARALVRDASVIIMDEPTSSLTATDTQALFAAIRRLKESGIAFIYISHFLEEVAEIAESFTVLRDGEVAGEGLMKDTTIPKLIQMMVGRPLTEMFPKAAHERGEVLLKVEGAEGKPLPKGVSLELRRGEILGLAGLVGSGRSETLRSLFGLIRAGSSPT
jgi:ribose transport system ATP-binding protein